MAAHAAIITDLAKALDPAFVKLFAASSAACVMSTALAKQVVEQIRRALAGNKP